MPKVTFSLDDETVEALRTAAARLGKPQSLIVREAVAEYTSREERLSDVERGRLLETLRRIRSRPVMRSQADVDRELRAIENAK